MNENSAYQEEVWDELIGGKLVAMSPRPAINHTRVSGNIFGIFRNYLKDKQCEPFPDGVDLYLSEEDRFIPDFMVVCDPKKIKPNGVYGAPELVVEVLSPSTMENDRTRKKDTYAGCGVLEYWIVSPGDKSIEQYLLRDGQFVLHGAYTLYPDWMLEQMSEEERSAVKTHFKCSLYDDLEIKTVHLGGLPLYAKETP